MNHHASFRIIAASLFFAAISAGSASGAEPSEKMFIWPDLAPGETTRETGEALPAREGEIRPITRVVKIRRPGMEVFLPPAEKASGTAILVLPGGGFGKVVPDMEGSEAAPWLSEMGIATFVLSYRTNETKPEDEPLWKRPCFHFKGNTLTSRMQPGNKISVNIEDRERFPPFDK